MIDSSTSASEPFVNDGEFDSRDARDGDSLRLIAYENLPDRTQMASMPIVPAPVSREWMEGIGGRNAHRCLPLLIANESGWLVLNTHRLVAVWKGGNARSDLIIAYPGGSPPYPASSHFGHGILTFTLPYLFRTPPGYNLLVRGPANWPKDGASPLEGVVEADWSEGTFTMNWQITRPNTAIAFGLNEPFCMIVPQRRGELESFQPEFRTLDAESPDGRNYTSWYQSRKDHHEERATLSPEAQRKLWQQHYVKGLSRTNDRAPEHQTKLKLRSWRKSG